MGSARDDVNDRLLMFRCNCVPFFKSFKVALLKQFHFGVIFVQTSAGLSVNSLDASSSETVNGGGQETVSGTSSPTVVIELTQQLTAKRPLRSEAQRERRSSAVNRSINGDISAGGVCSSPSQNSIASTLSSSSSDDQPPPLPAKQQGNVTAPVDQNPPEKPPLPATALTEIREDSAAPSNKNYNGSTPPPPPPKHLKPARPLPPM